jgi:hypothetical protein
MPVVWVRQLDSRDERLPAIHERVRERGFHLAEEPLEVGVGFFWRYTALGLEQAERAVKFV